MRKSYCEFKYCAYGLLLAFRAWLLFSFTSYIHPDEHMQCGEVMAGLHFPEMANVTNLPWEFAGKPQFLARSHVSAELLCGVPMLIWKYFLLHSPTSSGGGGAPILFAIKLWMFALSLLGDYLALVIFDFNWALLLLRASNWANIVLATKPFSNSLETLLFDAMLVLVLRFHGRERRAAAAFMGGALLGLGCFVRITFPAFAFVLVVRFLFADAGARMRVLFWAALGFALASAAALALDWYWNEFTLVLAPWENLKYNAQVDNLAKHGLHPRWMHVLVNFPLLFGPIAPASLYYAVWRHRQADFFLGAALIVPLLVLSAFPHQEARFLLPLQTLAVLLGGKVVLAGGARMRAFWLIFNLALCILFGALHQGGVIDYIASGPECRVIRGEQVYTLPMYLQPPPPSTTSTCRAVLRPETILSENECAADKVIWRYAYPHFNAEAGGFTTLVAVQVE